MTADARAGATLDVVHEAHVRRWWHEQVATGYSLRRAQLLPDPAERSLPRIGSGGRLRVAVLAAADAALDGAARRGLLAAGADQTVWLRSDDGRTFGERAEALRTARPDLVIVLGGDPRHADAVVDLCEAFRAGCADQSPAPRAVVAGDARTTMRLHGTLARFGVEVLPDPRRAEGHAALVGRAREFRRGTDTRLTLRDEALEALASALARVAGAPALVADVAGGTTSLVHATADGAVAAAHLNGIGVGKGADSIVAKGGLDRVRRWIPRAIDAPSLLERVFNRARWPDAIAADEMTLALEAALAREAIGHALDDAAAAGLPVAAWRSAKLIALTGRVAELPRPAETLLVALDALQPTSLCSILRDAEDALVAIGGLGSAGARDGTAGSLRWLETEVGAWHQALALVAPLERAATLRVVSEGVRHEERIAYGSLRALSYRGTIELSAPGTRLRGRGVAGPLGLVIDARGRPLVLPTRDAERVPVVAGWAAALGVRPAERQ